VLGPNYNQIGNGRSNNELPKVNTATVSASSDASPGVGGGFFSQADATAAYPMYPGNQQSQMPPPLQARLSYSSQQSPLSPTFQNTVNRQSIQGISVPQVSNDVQNGYGGALFDPSNPAIFNFDLEGLNFGNHYGALEFGMLGHMSSGAADTPPKDSAGSISSQGMGDVSFNNGNVFGFNLTQPNQMFPQDMMQDFVGVERQNSAGQIFTSSAHHGLPRAYAIATGPASQPSPSTDASPGGSGIGFDSSPRAAQNYTPPNTTTRSAKWQESKAAASSKYGPSSILGKRTRDPSSIYDTVKEPYSYTTGFHKLTAFLQRRFSANKTLQIAKSLASIRPSFISCTKTLNRQDLVFMEKCFQRTLFEYEEFMLNCCTPTLVCRRTGEVAAVNKEFTLLTGWKKDVLLGKEPNLNITTGRNREAGSAPTSGGNTGRAGLSTPRLLPLSLPEPQGTGEGRSQSVFLAELLDDDSVIAFYEDFARLAFGDSRGSVTTRCKLLKYQTNDGTQESPEAKENGKIKLPDNGGIGGLGNRVREIDGEHGIGRLERDGKMDCSYCWTVKRDVFDIPMLIVMNVCPPSLLNPSPDFH
jgi:hypothetical protein